MGSEQNRRNGLSRDTDGAKGYADQFTILGVDIDPEALKKRYDGTKRHAYVCAVIDGLVQKQRTKTGKAPAWMVRVLRTATHIPPIKVADLGRDGTLDGWDDSSGKRKKAGKNWALVDDGRQRVMATRENDAASGATGQPRRMLSCIYETYSAKDTYADAVMSRVGANLREARTFSQRAEDAADMARAKYAESDIAPYVEARDGAEVLLLLALDKCEQGVKDAVDAGRVPIADCSVLSRLSPEEQVRRVARKTAGDGKGAKDRAAAPRAKTKPAPVLASWESEIRGALEPLVEPTKREEMFLLHGYAAALAAAQGKAPPAWAVKFHESAEQARKAGGK